MNEFTKEELIDLSAICKAAYLSGKIDPQITLKMKTKIQSIIDNYCCDDRCELASQRQDDTFATAFCCGDELTYINASWSIPKCGKCGRVLNDNESF